MIASHYKNCARNWRSRSQGNRAFSILELVFAATLFASMLIVTVLAIRSARAPQFEAQSRQELLEDITTYVNEAAVEQADAVFDGTFTPPFQCPGVPMSSCILVGNTEFTVDWQIAARPDLGGTPGSPSVAELSASATAADGERYYRSTLVSNPSSSALATLSVLFTGDLTGDQPLEILNSSSGSTVAVAAVNSLSRTARATLAASNCSPACTAAGQIFTLQDGIVTSISLNDVSLGVTSAVSGGSLTLGQGETLPWSAPGVSGWVAFDTGSAVSGAPCNGSCTLTAAPSAEPGSYEVTFTSTGGQRGTITVTVTAQATSLFVSDITAFNGETVTAQVEARDGTGQPVPAEVCFRKSVELPCTVSELSLGATGIAGWTFTASALDAGDWVAQAIDATAEVEFEISIVSNPAAPPTPSVTLSETVLEVTYTGLVPATALELSGTPPEGMFGPAGVVLADETGTAVLRFSPGAYLSQVSGLTVCYAGTASCSVVP